MQHVYNSTGHAMKIPDVVCGQGIYLTDANGKKYMDLESGVWCLPLGHNHPAVNEVIKSRLATLGHAGFCYSCPEVDTAAELVLDITGLDRGGCVFLCSGSEAIEYCRQVARLITGRTNAMTLHDSYLGSYSSVTDRSRDWYIFNWEACQACEKARICDTSCALFQKIPEDISGFIFEPGSASGFVRFPPGAMIRNLVQRVRDSGGLILVNEVTTGMGRTGRWFGFNHYGIRPDMIAIGKGIGNGYPVSVSVLSRALVEKAQSMGFKYAQSHQNDPMGAAVAAQVIRTITDNKLLKSAETKGRQLREQLRTLVDHRIIRDVRGRGLMLALEFTASALADTVYEELLEAGYIVCNRGGFFRIDPPLITPMDELKRFVQTLKQCIDSVWVSRPALSR